jgi:RNA polymerase sigma-70 factor (ECF subfamily)
LPDKEPWESALQRQAQTAASDLSALLRRVAARDRAAFSALYDVTSAKLYGVVVRILHRRDLADDVLQEVYIRIWERAVDYDGGKGSPIAWMAAIARNRALDEVRRKAPVSIEDAPETLEVVSDEPSPLDNLNQSQDMQRLARCLDGLEPDKRDMVVLAYRQGLSREELAERYGRPVPTIKTWLRRSLAQLRDCLGT